jgi:integration host factor subunit alpha
MFSATKDRRVTYLTSSVCFAMFTHPTRTNIHQRKVHIMALTKADIFEAIQSEMGFTKNQSVDLIESLIETIKSTLASGEDALVAGFGKFCVQEKSEPRGRNPATGEDLMLPPRRVVTFKCSGQLRERVNG